MHCGEPGKEGVVTLVEMRTGADAIVVGIEGGRGVEGRLDGLGIRAGVRITKTGGLPMRGPVTVRVGRSSVAIGYGMAAKVIVEVEVRGGAK